MVVVTHGGFLHAAYHKATGSSSPAKIGNCCLGVVKIEVVETRQSRLATWALMSWAETPHLESFSSAGFGGSCAGV